MTVYIKGMEMPTSCDGCQLNYDCCACILTGSRYYKHGVEFDPEKGRLPDCPLVQVPPHGDLIDKETVSNNLVSVLNKKNPPFSFPDWNDAISAMLTAPTIIPASKEGEA